jgi:cytoskeletal protein CcmA (bactofilin family)
MAVFSSGADRTGESAARQASREGNLSIIAAGMRVVGETATDGVLKVEGVIEGTIRADREVLVAKGGTIEGDIYTREVVVGGKVVGSIYADERVEVQQDSLVQGDIVTKKLIVHEGGEVNGNVRMGEPNALEQGKAVAAAREAVPAGGGEREAYS